MRCWTCLQRRPGIEYFSVKDHSGAKVEYAICADCREQLAPYREQIEWIIASGRSDG